MLSLNNEQMEIYKENEKMIDVIVNAEYYGRAKVHGLDLDDLKQYGRIGLIKGIKDYEEGHDTQETTFYASNIHWAIKNGFREVSLRITTQRDKEAINLLSLHNEKDEDLDFNFEKDRIPDDTDFFVDYEALEELDENLPHVIKLILEDKDFSEIEKLLNRGRHFVRRLLNRHKDEIMNHVFAK